MSIDFGAGIGAKDGEDFSESGAKQLPPTGWGLFAILGHEEKDGNLFIQCQMQDGIEHDIVIWFNGSEKAKRFAKPTLGKVVEAAAPTATIKTMQDLQKLYGQKLDIKISHFDSKKKKDDGTPFKNAGSQNFAPPGTKSSVAAEQKTEPETGKAAADPWG